MCKFNGNNFAQLQPETILHFIIELAEKREKLHYYITAEAK